MKEAPLTEGGLSDPSGRFFRLSPRLSGAHRGPSKRDAIWARAMYWLAPRSRRRRSWPLGGA